MAELRDVYSLEFNSSQFQSEIQSAIGRIEELNAAMEEGADVADQLAEAQGSLVDILGTEAKGIEQLNQKRNVLVSTSKQLNAESKTGVAVGKQLDATNKQIAVSTGNAVKAQKGFGASLLDGVKNISKMRRVLSTLQFAFRAVTAAIPFGLILSFAGPVISFFSSLFKKTDENAAAMEKLKDANLGYSERLDIIKGELERLEEVEKRRGRLTDEEKQQRDELTEKYRQTADEIVKIEQERFQEIERLQDTAARLRVRLLGDTVQAAEQNYITERKILERELSRRFKEIEKAEREGVFNSQQLADLRAEALEVYRLEEINLEREKFQAINRIAEQARKEREQKEREELERLKGLAIEEFNMRKAFFDELARREQELADERERIRQATIDAIKAEQKAYEDNLNTLKANLDEASKYRQTIAEDNLNMALLDLEKQRNAELLAAFGNADEQAKIDKEYNDKRAEFEKMANQEIIKIRIEFLKKLRDVSADDPAALASLNKQISELELQFEELNRTASDSIDKTKDKYKELAEQAGQVLQLASDTVFSVLNAQVTAYIDNLDRAIDRSKSALDEIRQNSENFNARQLELEKERLEKLENERAQAVEREKLLGQIQIAINAAIAISKAAAEGGAAAPFTIAATLASLIAGFIQARAAAGNAFYEGVEYLERGNNPRGRDTIPAMLNEGERVITTDTNNKYWDVLSAVHNNRIPADVLNSFANAYQQGGLRAALGAFGDNISLAGELGQKSVFVNVAHNNSGLENRLERIEQVLTELPKYMPKTVVQANAKGIFRIVEQRQQRKDYSRNWAK